MAKSQHTRTLNLTTLLLVLSTAACSQKAPEAWRHVPAGQSAAAMGIVIDGGSVSDMKELEAKGGTIREIYGEVGMYEVFGLTKQEVEAVVDENSKVYKNEFIPMQIGLRPTPAPERPQDCQDVPNRPLFGFASLPQEIAGSRRGPATIRRTTQKIRIGIAGPGLSQIKYSLGLMGAPPTSSLHPANRPGNSTITADGTFIEFVADEVGQYEVGLLVNLPGGITCVGSLEFAVTDDAPFAGNGPPVGTDLAKKLASFPHLKLIGADAAWPSTQGAGVGIAIVDSGVNYNHPALRYNIAVNPREIPGNGKDDDGNGIPDDSIGYDFANNDPYPFDDYGHGSHVAGLAASAVGVAPQAKILAVKVMGAFGGDIGSIAAGIKYSAMVGAKVINLSFGRSMPSELEKAAIDYAESRGSLVVIAVGNDGSDIDRRPVFPATLPNPNILTIAASDEAGNLTRYSNYGATMVDMVAPGGSEQAPLLSAYCANLKNHLWFQSVGTSMAAPVASGVAALAWSLNPNLSAIQIKQLLMDRGTARPDYRGRVLSSKLIDARNLVTRLSLE